jgi:hypothetical protein
MKDAALSGSSLRISFLLLAALSLSSLVFTGCRMEKAPSVGYNEGYAPEQPMPFKHSLHAGTYQIPCQYCHVGTETSKYATVPALNICMNCHVAVKTDSPWIKQLREANEKGLSIPWIRVHMLPDFVRFNHSPHIKKGVACQTCHGPVETMDVLYQHSDLSMGWCVNCHRKPEHNASINCSTCHY